MQPLLLLVQPKMQCLCWNNLKHRFVMQNLAYVSSDMATSIGVHGGAQQLLDILQAGFQQVRVWLSHACLSICIKLSTSICAPASAKQQEEQAMQLTDSADHLS